MPTKPNYNPKILHTSVSLYTGYLAGTPLSAFSLTHWETCQIYAYIRGFLTHRKHVSMLTRALYISTIMVTYIEIKRYAYVFPNIKGNMSQFTCYASVFPRKKKGTCLNLHAMRAFSSRHYTLCEHKAKQMEHA